ncbi:MAG: DUF2971 domain-containing protein [Cytophagales bacterium]|nr:DUF2971 domain-containing protein [Cytophagales bacterium]
MITKGFSEKFENNNTLYHYTDFNTALEHILRDFRLRLSPITLANDPMESEKPAPISSCSGCYDQVEKHNTKYNSLELTRSVTEYYEQLRQLCLCKNSNEAINGIHTSPFEPIEHFGFAKPRMWDQYGNKYRGVCFAISNEKFKQSLESKFKVLEVDYTRNYLLKANLDTLGINLNEVEELGQEEYLRLKYESELQKIREKHIDYRDENECKIIVRSNSEYEYVSIKNSLQAVFCTKKLGYSNRCEINKVLKKYKIPLIEIHFSREGLSISQFEKIDFDC